MALTRQQILAADDLAGKLEPIEVPEWGGTVYVRVMSGSQRDRFEEGFAKNRANARATLAAYTLCDEAGKPLFTAADLPTLGDRSSVVLDRIALVSMRLNAIGKPDIDELEKNSGAILSDSTASDTPA